MRLDDDRIHSGRKEHIYYSAPGNLYNSRAIPPHFVFGSLELIGINSPLFRKGENQSRQTQFSVIIQDLVYDLSVFFRLLAPTLAVLQQTGLML